ncbi:VOC family protein [Streptomyces sp. NPDC048275]|uniref:VOC family protein n=1 Tax=Streptomyces sp. NPDC048275 TaxID=3155629 RepID=UPI0033E94AA4
MGHGHAAGGRVLKAEDLFHLGIVVEDFEATLAEFSALFGYEWCDEIGGPLPVTLSGGDAVVDIGCVFSRTSPRLEIVRRVPGTLWEPAAGGAVHHVGYWSDDVAADTAELAAQGFVTEATRAGVDGAPFAFLRSATTGYRVELVSRASQPGLERYWGDRHESVPVPVPARSRAAGGRDA